MTQAHVTKNTTKFVAYECIFLAHLLMNSLDTTESEPLLPSHKVRYEMRLLCLPVCYSLYTYELGFGKTHQEFRLSL